MLQVILAFNNSLLTLKTTWKLNVIYFSLFENHTLCLMQSLGTLLKLVLNPFWKCHTCKDASKQWESEDFSVCTEFFSLPFPSVNLAISESFFLFFFSVISQKCNVMPVPGKWIKTFFACVRYVWKYKGSRKKSVTDIRYINAFDWFAETKMSL